MRACPACPRVGASRRLRPRTPACAARRARTPHPRALAPHPNTTQCVTTVAAGGDVDTLLVTGRRCKR